MSIEAMKQALEALEKMRYRALCDKIADPAITSLRQAIEIAEADKSNYQEGYAAGYLEGKAAATEESSATQAPVAWAGYNLDDMCEAFHRVIEEHHSRTNPYPDPVNKDAMLALRILRGFIPQMKAYTHPQPKADHIPDATKMVEPKREPLTDEQWQQLADIIDTILTRETKDAIESVLGIKGEA